jgi:broad specificity phosphatase PhoE
MRSANSNSSRGTPRDIFFTLESNTLMVDSLVVIQSGATAYDLQGRIRGTLDMPLCTEGVAAAEQTAESLLKTASSRGPMAALYTAATSCAVETARIIGGVVGLTPRRVAGLDNLDQGLWQGMLVDEIRRRQPKLSRQWQENPWSVSPPDGELVADACDRVEAALERMLKRHAGGRVGLVVPRPLDQVVRWLTGGEAIGDLWTQDAATASASEIAMAEQWASAAVLEKIRN